MLREECKRLKECMNRVASNEVTGSRVMASYSSQFFNDFTKNLEVKAIGVMALLCCLMTVIARILKGTMPSIPSSRSPKEKKSRKAIKRKSRDSTTDDDSSVGI